MRLDALASTRRIEWIAAIVVLMLLVAGCVLVLRPFFNAVLWAMVLTFSTWPLYARLEPRVGHKRWLAALLMTLLLAAAFVVPLAFLSTTLARHATRAIDLVRSLLSQGPPAPPAWVAGLPIVGRGPGADLVGVRRRQRPLRRSRHPLPAAAARLGDHERARHRQRRARAHDRPPGRLLLLPGRARRRRAGEPARPPPGRRPGAAPVRGRGSHRPRRGLRHRRHRPDPGRARRSGPVARGRAGRGLPRLRHLLPRLRALGTAPRLGAGRRSGCSRTARSAASSSSASGRS